jgi:hypothetical protein
LNATGIDFSKNMLFGRVATVKAEKAAFEAKKKALEAQQTAAAVSSSVTKVDMTAASNLKI